MRTSLSSFVLIILCTATLQCSKISEPTQADPSPEPSRTVAELTEQEASLVESANRFAFDLFGKIAERTPNTENIFISPLSVSYALALCYNGADGDTREAIAATLRLADLSIDEINPAYHDLTNILVRTDPQVDFRLANSFWSRQGKAIQPAFISLAQEYYDARVEEIDFQSAGAADTINTWIESATNGKITEMVRPPIDPSTAAMLFNAIYFKGDWMFPFDTANTRVDTFHLADGSNVECDMMYIDERDCVMPSDGDHYSRLDTNIVFYDDREVLVLTMPYGSGDYRMSIVVPQPWGSTGPDTTTTIDDIIANLTYEKWNSWQTDHTPYKISLRLPRFRFEYNVSLNDALKSLGMEIAFNPGSANFGNMFIDGIGWIDEAKQKTFIEVNEVGTEAAAVTQIVFADSIPPPVDCDKPFLIVIHEDVSGAILFIGKIANPVWEE